MPALTYAREHLEVAGMLASTNRPSSRRGPKPILAPERIRERALAILDEGGTDALTVRALAADLKISTRTLYKRIGCRDNLIDDVIALHCARLNFVVRVFDSWQTTVLQFCTSLHRALVAHPHLTMLTAVHIGPTVRGQVGELVSIVERAGVPRGRASDCCRAMIAVTINDALARVRTVPPGPETRTTEICAQELAGTLRMILDGVSRSALP